MTGAIEQLRDRYLTAQLKGDRREALRLVFEDGLDKGIEAPVITEGVVREAQRAIGRLWQENQIGIADEHMATAISHLVLAQLYQRAEHARPNGKRIMVACIEGELHELPARFVADALDTAGFDVRFLGADVPTDHLLRMIQSEPPDLLALSATMSFHGSTLRDVVQRVRALRPSLLIAVGGNACDWSPTLAEQIGADLTAASAQDLIESARRLLGVAT